MQVKKKQDTDSISLLGIQHKFRQQKEKKEHHIKSLYKKVEEIRSNRILLYLSITISLLISLVVILKLIDFFSVRYYIGTWQAQLSESEKQAGITATIYDIKENDIQIKYELELEQNIQITLRKKLDLQLLEQFSNEATYKIISITLQDINIKFKTQNTCRSMNECQEIENKIKENIKKSIAELSNTLKEKIIKIIKNRNGIIIRISIPGQEDIILNRLTK